MAYAGRKAHRLPQSALTLDDNGTLGFRILDAENRALFRPLTLLQDIAQDVWLADLPKTVDVIVI